MSMIIKSKIQFVRYGGLSSVIQNGYTVKNEDEFFGFHIPPTRKGVYAFVYPYIEMFLLSTNVFSSHRMIWVKDENGDKITDKNTDKKGFFVWKDCKSKNQFDKMIEDDCTQDELDTFRVKNQFLAVNSFQKKFYYEGDIWHHLKITRNHVLQEKDSWVLTNFESYKNALKKEIGQMNKYRKNNGVDYSKDHLEVFIEKI